jgi:hypothetical protein
VERSKRGEGSRLQVFLVRLVNSAWNIGGIDRITAMKKISTKNIGLYLASGELNMN